MGYASQRQAEFDQLPRELQLDILCSISPRDINELKPFLKEKPMTTWNELTEAEQLLNNYSDDYKDKFGFRPRGLTPEQVASVEWLKDAIDGLSDFNEDGDLPVDGNYDEEDDGQPSEYEEYQDFYGGDDWDHGQYDDF